MVMGHGRGTGVSASVAQAERLRRLAQILILRADLLFGVDAIIVRNDVADGSSRAIWLTIGMRLLGQQHRLVAHAELETRQAGPRCAAEGRLGAARRSLRIGE